MAVQQTSFVTVTCDGPTCDKSVTFPANEEAQREAIEANPWMRSNRRVIAADNRQFLYCSDECEAKALATGVHNEQKIIRGDNVNVEQAAAQAKLQREANQALHSGPVKLT